MASAPIEITLPGLTGFTLTLTLYPHGSDTAAVSGLTLTEATNRKCTYTTSTTAALSGTHLAVALESTTVRGEGYVFMDNSTSNHVVQDSPNAANVTATQTNSVMVSDTLAIESGITLEKAVRAMAAILCGIISGAPNGIEVFKGIGLASGGTTRVTVTVDDDGNRSAITLNL